MSVRKVFWNIKIDIVACLAESRPFALAHLNHCGAFFSYIAAPQFIEFFHLTTTFNTLLNERRSNLLTRRRVIKAAHGFERIIAMKTKTINTEACSFFLPGCCIDTLSFAIWSCSLEIGLDHKLEATSLVLSRFESAYLWIETPTPKKTNGFGLTYRIWI